MEAIILAGGFGTRLAHIVTDVPKPMAPVCGQPFLRYVMNDIIAKGVDRIVLAVGYKQEVISNYFGTNYRGAQILYSSEETPLFTGGAIKQALRLCKEDCVFVVNGDTFFDVDLKKMSVFHKENNADITVATKEMRNFDRYGTLIINGDRILSFKEKKQMSSGSINGGIYLIQKSLLENYYEDRFSFEKEILEKKIKGLRIYSYEGSGYFIDIGIPEDYFKAQEAFKNKEHIEKAAFFDRDGTINVDIGYLHKKENLVFIKGRPELIKQYNDDGYFVIVVTNQSGIARGLYTEDDMRELHRYMNERLAEYGAHIDAFYFCPHHPDFTGPCHCRKPEPGMIEQAIRDFDLDPKQCLLFGDNKSDLEAAKKSQIPIFNLLKI